MGTLHLINQMKNLSFVIKKIFCKLLGLLTNSPQFYPKLIKKQYKRCISNIKEPEFSYHGFSSLKRTQSLKIKLAINFLHLEDTIKWYELTFDDPEQLVSLHRWGWLLHLNLMDSEEEFVQKGLSLISDWCENVKPDLKHLVFESYTMGERICNAVLFAHFTQIYLPEIVQVALRQTTKLLSGRIEYYWFDTAGNHVLNNARALYFAGYYFNVREYVQLATSILNHELERLFYKDGFLREGSSHYHFLITRWLLEIDWNAQLHCDNVLHERLKNILILAISRCWFFLVQEKVSGVYFIPLIGDVSPDFTWEWLTDLPWSKLAQIYCPKTDLPAPVVKGWGALFGRVSHAGTVIVSTTEEPRFQSFPESGWYRLDWGDMTIFWHVEPMGSPNFASHGHCDTGSFCLYWQGSEVLMDPGRFNYQWDNPMGVYGVGAAAHNSLCIDGFDPFVYINRSHYPVSYIQKRVKVHHEINEHLFHLCIEHEGFTRLRGDTIVHQRHFYIQNNELIIEDKLQGKKLHRVQTYFQWSPGANLRPQAIENKFDVFCSDSTYEATFSCLESSSLINATILSGQENELIAGWKFPGYGLKVPASTLIVESTSVFPFSVKYHLKFNK